MKLAILAKAGIFIDILREAPPDKVTFPPEPICKEYQLKLVYNCLKKLDEVNLRINLPKCHIVKIDVEWVEWLGYKFTHSGIAPIETKTSAILNLAVPKNLKRLRLFLGPVHYLGKFSPNPTQLCYPFRLLLKKNTKFIWNNEFETHFQHIKDKVAKATKNKRYYSHLETPIKCNASRAGLGAVLEQ